MKLVKEPATLEFRNEKFEVVYHSYLCEESGEHFTTNELDTINQRQVFDQYHQKHPESL